MSDLVKRLRERADTPREDILGSYRSMMKEAAAEIERLTELLNRVKRGVEFGRPERVFVYDEEGVEAWQWTHPETGEECFEVELHDEFQIAHPDVLAAISEFKEPRNG